MLTITIDWLAGTFLGEKPHETEFIDKYARAEPIGSMGVRHGYSQAEADSHGVQLLWNPNRAEMGIHVVFPGSALRALQETAGIHMAALLRDATNAGMSITRLDLAKDLTERQVNYQAIYQSLERGSNEGTARSWGKIESSGGGFTIYIGSRQSEKFCRIYDKAAESQLPGELWSRFEIETKGMVARAVAQSLVQTGDYAACFDTLALSMCKLPKCADYDAFFQPGHTTVGLPKIERRSDREAWIESQVIPAVGKHYIDNPNSEAIARLIATLQGIDRQRKLDLDSET